MGRQFQKQRLSTKLHFQEIRWNCRIFCGVDVHSGLTFFDQFRSYPHSICESFTNAVGILVVKMHVGYISIYYLLIKSSGDLPDYNSVKHKHEPNTKKVMSAFTLNEKMVWILRWSYEVLSWGNYHKKSHKWIVVLSYFNAQIKIWYESGKITYRGTEIDGVMCQFEF